MTMLIFPSSPVWGNITREPMWSEEVYHYDSGARQASSPWSRPLYRYNINAKNFNENKQAPLHTFVNSNKGRVQPFLFKDPYDYTVASWTLPAAAGMGVGSGFFFTNDRDWRVIPDSAFMSITATDSGAITNGVDFVLSQDNGWCALLVVVTSLWVSSFEYFRKSAFDTSYVEQSGIWNQFSANLVIRELIPDQ